MVPMHRQAYASVSRFMGNETVVVRTCFSFIALLLILGPPKNRLPAVTCPTLGSYFSFRRAYPAGIIASLPSDREKENGVCHYCRTLPMPFDSYVGSFPREALKE